MAERIPRPSLQRDSSERIPIQVENGVTVLKYATTNNEFDKERKCSEYIRSWAGVTRGFDVLDFNGSMNSLSALKFEVVSARTIATRREKYVAYTVRVTLPGTEDDPYPAVLERRYTEFLRLYAALRREYPDQLQTVRFPRKAIVGNFSPETISGRSEGFERFLELIGSTTAFRNSPKVTDFLQRQELIYALKLLKSDDYDQASTLVENCFSLMNKLQTARSPAVLHNLCLLICIYAKMNDPKAMDLACLAVRRFQGVSDADLLKYYVPLLNISLELSEKYGKATSMLQDHLAQLRIRGVALHDTTPLMTLLIDDLCPVAE